MRNKTCYKLIIFLISVVLFNSSCQSARKTTSSNKLVASSFGTYTNHESAQYNGWERSSVYVPMKDGTRVAVDTYLPTKNGIKIDKLVPVILHYTRYIRAKEIDGKLLTKVDRDPILQHMLKHGYAVAVVDARGTGASFGVHNGPISVEESQDSYDIIEWLGAQPWSSGRVGMAGRSYPGITQYQAAVNAPPSLKAIFPEMAGSTIFDFIFKGGIYKQNYIEKWGAITQKMDEGNMGAPARVDADIDGSMRKSAIAEHRNNVWVKDLTEDKTSRFRDGKNPEESSITWSWDTVGVIDDIEMYDSSGVAIYHYVGWYDIYTSQQTLLYTILQKTKTPQKMIIGPWVHTDGYGGTVHKAEILRWYDYWLKGIDNGVMDEPPVHYFVMQGNNTLPTAKDTKKSIDEMNAEEAVLWRSSVDWPPADLQRTAYFFGKGSSGTIASINDGSLTLKADNNLAKDEHTINYTSSSGSFSRWMSGLGLRRELPTGTTFFDTRNVENKKILTYTSEPLEQELEILGYPIIHLWVTSNQPDGDFFVYLEEVDSDGLSHYISEGVIRASYRSLTKGFWNELGIPHHPSLKEDLVSLPEEPVELLFDLTGTAIVIDKGHRLRVSVAGADVANYELFPDPRGEDAPTVMIYRGGNKSSYIELPYLQK